MNKQHAVKAGFAALALGATLGLAGCGNNDAGEMGGMGGMESSAPQTAQAPTPSPSSSTAAEFNDADVMFAQMMIPHHKQAVAMSDTILKKSGVSGEVTKLAEGIKAAQQPEIETMSGFLEAWGQKMDGGMGGMGQGGDGMATKAELAQLEQADGADAQKMFLEMMVKHHTAAIAMAQAEVKDGKNAEAVQLAKDIVAMQQEEISTIKGILAGL
jgi:uncharacterized protein (DUF305 family)